MAKETSNLTISNESPGIRLYIEDPKLAISRKIRRSIYIILSVLIVASIVIFLAIKYINSVSAALSENQKKISEKLSNTQTINQNNWQEISPYADKIKNALPPSTDLLAYQGALEQAAQAAGVQVAVSFSSAAASKSVGVDHNVEVKGNLPNILQFLESMENLPYYVQMNTFNITSPQGPDKESTASLSMKVYTQ